MDLNDSLPLDVADGIARLIKQPGCDVLVVEDDAATRDAIEFTLEEEGLRVMAAAAGSEALRLLRGGAIPEAMLIDLTMPQMTGDQLVGAIRADRALSHIPVIIITGASAAPPLPVAAILKKPFRAADLLRALWPLVRGTPYPG
jgi:CheY-like chemotaxis protein